ncbi:DUF1749-domain-containing protein [Lojkania enalia]|uniref:DUF1749-domain-containing protein n=1 Tax=Lojkania enalia TaxID=147567 RepID=A0A9P4NBB1_9PLEO|nr:DUF1749-domain-containing protein [Didymosphaeria enalia]
MANPGVLHQCTPRLVAFEHVLSASANPTPNTLLWIGGLGDGFLTVKYPKVIARLLPPDWSLVEVLLSSGYKGWGVGSLKRDARELGQCVEYFKASRLDKKVVLMGHSTGCQDVMEYLVGDVADDKPRPSVDGAILQGGLSDREAFGDIAQKQGFKEKFDEIVKLAKEMIDQGREHEIVPRRDNPVSDLLGAPITAYRTFSLLAPGGDDDYFSSDLSDSTLASTFGKIPKETPVMFLLGAGDPYVPAYVDKEQLIGRFTRAIRDGGGVVDDINGGVVPEAQHNLNDNTEEVREMLARRVVGFLQAVGTGVTPGTSRL